MSYRSECSTIDLITIRQMNSISNGKGSGYKSIKIKIAIRLGNLWIYLLFIIFTAFAWFIYLFHLLLLYFNCTTVIPIQKRRRITAAEPDDESGDDEHLEGLGEVAETEEDRRDVAEHVTD